MQKEIYQYLERYNINFLIVFKDMSSLDDDDGSIKQSILEKSEGYAILKVPDDLKKDYPYENFAVILIDEFRRLVDEDRLNKITSITISEIDPVTLPIEFWQLTSLNSLDLSGDKLTALNPFGLSDDELTTLPAEIGQLTNLTSLNLSYTKLPTLPAELWQLTNLTSLNLSGNQLATLPAENRATHQPDFAQPVWKPADHLACRNWATHQPNFAQSLG